MSDKELRESYIYNLRHNNILAWVDNLKEVNEFKTILKTCVMSSTLEVESGIVRIDPSHKYISHRFAPHVKADFNFYEICVIMRYEVIKFESDYGEVSLSESDIDMLAKTIYFFNRTVHGDFSMSDKKLLRHLKDTAEVLYYLLGRSIKLTNKTNGWCSLEFTVPNNTIKDYCTILTEEQIKVLERVSMSINKSVQL